MMSMKLSQKTIVFILFIFSIHFYNKIERVIKNKDTCICSYDGFGYYMYNPFLFSNGSLNLNSNWAKSIQDEYCDSTIVYQFQPTANGNELNIYHMGLAIIQLPSYLIADLYALSFEFKRDGFSKPYHILYIINVLFFIFIGLLYLKKLLLLFFSDNLTSVIILISYLGTNALITIGLQYDLVHLYLFALNSIFAYHIFKYQKTKINNHLIYSAIILGLTVCIRPTQALLGILPLFILLNVFKEQKIVALKKVLWFPFFGLIWNLPQIYYWWIVGGTLFAPNMHTEEMIIVDPNIIDFLFSFKKGWLLYSPIFLLLPIGFSHLYKENKNEFWAILSFTLLYIIVMSSWECWWYASSFGSRVMVDIYPLLAIIIGFTILSAKRGWKKNTVLIFVVGCVSLSLFQSFQANEYIIHPERMNKEQYWYVFGKTDVTKIDIIRLEIDRGNTNWINQLDDYKKHGIDHEKKVIYKFDKPIKAAPKEDLLINKFKLLDKIPNDETCFIVTFKAMTSDSTKSSVLRMETVSSYNCYGWDNIEISTNNGQNIYTDFSFQFSLRNLRHTRDKMQIYIDNNDDVTVKIKDFKIEAITLIR